MQQVWSRCVPLLRRCLADLRAHDEEDLLSYLYSARKRGMRPMQEWITMFVSDPDVLDLFLDAGPERDD